jgi:uncharacterized protein YhjY with autotransporter beta-barrel domain
VNTNPEVATGNTTGTGTNIDGVTSTQGAITFTLSSGSSLVAETEGISNTNVGSTSTVDVLSGSSITTMPSGIVLFDAIHLYGNGTVNNAGSVVSTSNDAVRIDGSGSVTNTGTINGAHDGVYFSSGASTGTVTNHGTITGVAHGVLLQGAGTITNTGTIQNTTGIGVEIGGLGSLDNDGGNIITTETTAVQLNATDGTVTNSYGTISGDGDSVLVKGAHSTVTVGPWSQFVGTIDGFNVTKDSTLDFDLTGLTPSEVAALPGLIAEQGADGSITVHGVTYTWANFKNLDTVASFSSYELEALTPNQHSIATVLDNINTFPSSSMLVLLQDLDDSGNVPVALDELSPEKLEIFHNVAFDNFGFEATQLDDHLASLRYRQGGLDTSGLEVMDSSMPSMLSEIRDHLLAWSPPAANGTISDVVDPVLGGVQVSDAKDMKEIVPVTDQDRWSTFISGNVILAGVGSNPDLSHANYTTSGILAGADYRLDDNWAVGGLFSYRHTAANLDDIGSKATVDSYTPGIYATYADQGWFANGLFAYDRNDYGESRAIPFAATTASGRPGGNQFDGDLDGGYEFRSGDWTFGPTAALQYVHLDIDSFTESGAGAADLAINDQNDDSLRSRLGGEMRYNWSWYGGKATATPHLSASWQHEFLANSTGITSQFSGQGISPFTVNTVMSGRDSALVDVGLDTQWNQALNLFVDYQVQAGQDNFFAQSILAGVKVSF